MYSANVSDAGLFFKCIRVRQVDDEVEWGIAIERQEMHGRETLYSCPEHFVSRRTLSKMKREERNKTRKRAIH